MDLNRLTRGDQVILVSGVILIVASFFNWLGARITRVGLAGTTKSFGVSQFSFADNAWGYTTTLIAVLFGIAMLAYAALKLFGLELPPRVGPLSAGGVSLGLGTISFVLVLTKLVLGARVDLTSFGLPSLPPGVGSALRISIHKTRDFGSFAGVVAAAGLAVGGFLNFQEERASHPDG